MNMTMGDAEYRALLSRWSRLKRAYSPDTRTELDEMSERLEAAELAGSVCRVSPVASSLAVSLLKERHETGHDIHIPSLDITIPGCRIADVVDDYAFAVGEAGNLSGVEL